MAILKIKNENGEFINIPSIKGDKGDGIPDGGTKGQVLRKTTDSTEWADLEIPNVNDMGTITVDDVKCKNLFTGFTIGRTLHVENGLEGDYEKGAVSDFIEVDFNKYPNYYLSGLTDTLNTFVAAYNQNKQYIGRTGGEKITEKKLTSNLFNVATSGLTDEIAYVRITHYGVNIETVKDLKVQLEIGDLKTNYTPSKNFGFETGSNENGSWIKYDDGTLKMYNKYTLSVTSENFTELIPGLYSYKSEYIDLPYTSATGVIPIVTVKSDTLDWVSRISGSNSQIGYTILTNNTSNRDIVVNVVAIGKWK